MIVNAQLVEGPSNRHVWAERYTFAAGEVYEVQDELVRVVAGRLDSRVYHEERERAKRKRPESLKAYELWLTATGEHEFGTAESHDRAKDLYERALALRPGWEAAAANRAIARLAEHLGAPAGEITRMTVWGNHSLSQVPDVTFARLRGEPVAVDQGWVESAFIPEVAARGAAQ